jgi:hypothetical protein
MWPSARRPLPRPRLHPHRLKRPHRRLGKPPLHPLGQARRLLRQQPRHSAPGQVAPVNMWNTQDFDMRQPIAGGMPATAKW